MSATCLNSAANIGIISIQISCSILWWQRSNACIHCQKTLNQKLELTDTLRLNVNRRDEWHFISIGVHLTHVGIVSNERLQIVGNGLRFVSSAQIRYEQVAHAIEIFNYFSQQMKVIFSLKSARKIS